MKMSIACYVILMAVTANAFAHSVECSDGAGDSLKLVVSQRITGALKLETNLGEIDQGIYSIEMGNNPGSQPTILFNITLSDLNSKGVTMGATAQFDGARLPEPGESTSARIYPTMKVGELNLSCKGTADLCQEPNTFKYCRLGGVSTQGGWLCLPSESPCPNFP